MRYLITTNDYRKPFLTNKFNINNDFDASVGMVVYDLVELTFTSDGKTWHDIGIGEYLRECHY